MNSPRSILPETMKELPSWYHKDVWATVPHPASKVRYNLHNPIGPRWYKNHHLIPASQTRPAARPPTVFSSSFPPITTSTSQERLDDATFLPGPSRSPSNSPLPTPNSSQTRVIDPSGKARSRKTSETAHDNVDLMDVTDPWGTNWHHHSPYDVGLGNEPISIEVLHTRSRRASMTTQGRRKSVVPSPLSQSTSAIHLSTSSNIVVHLPRKLSKRRTPTVASVFGSQKERKTVSLPATPVEPSGPLNPAVIPSGLPITSFQPSTSKKEKRGSILDRLVKKFSMLRKTSPDDRSGSRKEDDWQHISTFDTVGNLARRQGLSMNVQCAPEQPGTDVVNHVSPAMDDPAGGPKSEDIATDAADVDYSSIISFEAPFSIGRLTIANPDVPGSGDTTPAPREIPLPPDKSHAAVNRACASSPSSRIIPPELEEPVVQENRSQQPPIKGNEADVSTDEPATVSRHSGSERPKLPPEKTVTTSSARPVSIVSKNLGAQPPSAHDDNQSPYMRSPTSARNYPENRMSHSSQKRQPVPHLPEKVRPMSMAPSIPFPASDSTDTPSTRTPVPIPRPQSSIFTSSPFSAASMLANPPTPYSADSTPAPLPKQPQSYDYSPLSASSVLANPPTPHASNLPIHSPNKSQSLRTSHGNLPPNEPPNGQSSRQTETFKLVRSPSGHVYSTSETIVAGGQQWELVETSESKSRSKTSIKSKDRESKERLSRDRYSSERWERRQEGRSQAEPDVDPDHHRHSRSHRNEKVRSGERRSTPITSQPSLRDGTDVSPTRTRRESRKGTRGADVERDRRSDRKVVETSSSLDINKPQPPPPPTKDVVPPERRPSLSVRPTSQLPSAAEMTALRAKEAWDMERLWKARSMNGDEPNGYATFPSLSSSSKTEGNDDPDSRRAIHGSSHTAFVVQSPFQTQHSIYHSMPVAPPPIIYSSPSSLPQSTTSIPDQPKRKPYSTPIASNAKSLASSIRPPANNPLPQPPQESSYEPAPLPLPGSTGRSSDYWARLAGVTTSH